MKFILFLLILVIAAYVGAYFGHVLDRRLAQTPYNNRIEVATR
jgi:hypothetical protein